MPLTVSEIAQLLTEGSERQAALVERIRHWTREGLIEPTGEKNPGTGRHRGYDAKVLADVAILDALAALGIQVGHLHNLLKLAKVMIEDQPEPTKKDFLPCIEITPVRGDQLRLRGLYAKQVNKKGLYLEPEFEGDVTLLLNLSRIIGKINSIIQRLETGEG